MAYPAYLTDEDRQREAFLRQLEASQQQQAPQSQGMLQPGGGQPQGALQGPSLTPENHAALLQRMGMLPPERQVYQPTAEEQKEQRNRQIQAKFMNAAMALQGKPMVDPYAAAEETRALRQGEMDKQWEAQAERASAIRAATPDDYVGYMTDVATSGFPGSFSDWSVRQKAVANQAPADVQNYLFRKQLPPEEQAQFDKMQYSPRSLMNVGGYLRDPLTGQMVTSPEEIQRLEQEYTGAGAYGKGTGTGDAAIVTAAQQLPFQYQALEQTQEVMTGWLDNLDKGEVNPNIIQGLLVEYLGWTPFGEGDKLGELSADTLRAGVEAAKAAGLAPMSNADIEMILRSFANIAAGKSVNIGTLRSTLKKIDHQKQIMRGQGKYNLRVLKDTDPRRYNLMQEEFPFYQGLDSTVPPPPWEAE